MRKLMTTVVTLVVVAAMVRTRVARAAAAGNAASKGGAAVAFAKVDIAAQTILTFGGKGTTTAVVSAGGSTNGEAVVTFDGKYPKGVTTTQLVINATAESSNFGVANAQAISASPTQLVIDVFGWVSTTNVISAQKVFVSVFVGQ